jgi:ubiquinone/menaquinone biosynthesis C-methylase UbiE
LAVADFGCGDGPLFAALVKGGYIGPQRPVFAVDLAEERLARVVDRFDFIRPILGAADKKIPIEQGSLDFVISTMVMEHVEDERAYLNQISRVLRPGGRAYITTVFKREWAWYFRKRGGESVLDITHLREYTDLEAFRKLIMRDGFFAKILDLQIVPMWFPLLDPILFRLSPRSTPLVRILRSPKVPIPGYFSLGLVVER